ncbi:plasmid transfer protein TraB [Actinomadura viridis]|uniref:S-DNA-T family DNA segregation ATPase FtsK/SpoIIIE n=1 Tax=Actinomadura viridis TaxID=58110 RepID=A0A931GHW1_9ACTN|nr:FtsK/SpoIIIE domain-containing protein [Actinomadura viridis]MBG6087858.1 S-DNA-T family DNA segregation ATPase FtsK/SpoIIIE [Actinomadura viridis]
MSRTRQMRRHARKMRRNGLQPMVVINGDEPFPDLAAVVLGRLLWRYRSELAPFNLMATLALGGAVLHITHAWWWPYLLGVTTVAAWLLAMFGDRLGLALRSERLYGAALVMSAGGWIAAVTALGIAFQPLPQVLVGGGLLLAMPWWAHRRRRAKVRVDRQIAAWPEIAQSIGLPGSRAQSAVVDVWGWRARFALARGQTIQDVVAKVPAIESALGTFRGAVRVLPTRDDKANRFELRVLDTDPHADAIPWPGPSVSSISEPIDLGPFEDATSARVLLLRRHGLIGGVAGSGKSGGINVLMGNLSACRDVVIWAIDLKRGMELQPWASCIDRLATTPEQARALLRDALAVLEARAASLATLGRRVWEPSPDAPALVIVIDEYAELSDDATESASDTDSIARRGRAVAVTLVAATQRPTQKAMGKGAVRSQMDVRVSFRVRERKDVDLILGQGMLNAGWHAHTLNAPGKFLLSAPEHDVPRRGRAYLLTDEAVADAASRHHGIRPVLDEVSRTAIEEAHAGVQLRTASEPVTAETAEGTNRPDAVLWAMLAGAPDEGTPVSHLITGTGMSRPWIYQRLRELAEADRVTQVSRGRWRAAAEHAE